MSDTDAQNFINALRTLESKGDVEPLVALYAENAISTNLTGAKLQGLDGAREFWTTDRALFESVRSEFHHTVLDTDVSMLEWTRTGQGTNGADVYLPGVSVIQFSDGLISRFAAYLDPAALGEQSRQP